MAALSPYGLRSLYSHSNSSLAQSGVEEFPFPTTGGWYGFAGDVAVLNFYVASVPPDSFNNYVPQAPTGYVYPLPTGVVQTIYAPVIGVFEGFKYTPLGQPGYIKQSTNFIPGTLIEPETQVMAVVRVDLQGVFQVQAGGVNDEGVIVEYQDILTKGPLISLNTYQVNLPDVPNSPTPNPVNSLAFPMGNTAVDGLSGVYWQNAFDDLGNGTRISARLIGCVNPDDYSTSSNPVINPQVKVRIDATNAQSFTIVQPLTT